MILENFFHDVVKTVNITIIDLVINFSLYFFGSEIFGEKILFLNEINLLETVSLQHICKLNNRQLGVAFF